MKRLPAPSSTPLWGKFNPLSAVIWAPPPAGTSTSVVVDGAGDLNRSHHSADDLARREELAAVVSFLADLQQQNLCTAGRV
jgi:hypothetical protein